MSKPLFFLLALGITMSCNAQLIDEKNVSLSMDLQPILHLEVSGDQEVQFVFDETSDYAAGITKYGATQLKVNASIGWDLYAVAFGSSGPFCDNQLTYGSGNSAHAVNQIPCSILEIHQDKANPFPGTAGSFSDYSSPFQRTPVSSGANNIYTSPQPYIAPADGEKYIAGGNAAVISAVMPGGSYLQSNAGINYYYYSIDYRIVPGLPAVFPNAATNDGISNALVSPNYIEPGVYTMNVKFVLVEN
jgi:hypothetical protein